MREATSCKFAEGCSCTLEIPFLNNITHIVIHSPFRTIRFVTEFELQKLQIHHAYHKYQRARSPTQLLRFLLTSFSSALAVNSSETRAVARFPGYHWKRKLAEIMLKSSQSSASSSDGNTRLSESDITVAECKEKKRKNGPLIQLAALWLFVA